MAVSEQTDTLRVLRTDPVDYLVTPRVLACVLSMPILSLCAFTVGLASSVLLADVVYGACRVKPRPLSTLIPNVPACMCALAAAAACPCCGCGLDSDGGINLMKDIRTPRPEQASPPM